MKRILRTFFLLCLLLSSRSLLFSDDHFLIQGIGTQNGALVASFYAFVTDEIDLAGLLDDGMELTVEYHISLFLSREGFLRPDIELTNFTVTYNTEIDFINDGFQVRQSTASESVFWYRTSAEAVVRLCRLVETEICDLGFLSEGENYYIESSVDFTSLELYPPLSLIYGLLGKWNYSSPVTQSRIFNQNGIFVE